MAITFKMTDNIESFSHQQTLENTRRRAIKKQAQLDLRVSSYVRDDVT